MPRQNTKFSPLCFFSPGGSLPRPVRGRNTSHSRWLTGSGGGTGMAGIGLRGIYLPSHMSLAPGGVIIDSGSIPEFPNSFCFPSGSLLQRCTWKDAETELLPRFCIFRSPSGRQLALANDIDGTAGSKCTEFPRSVCFSEFAQPTLPKAVALILAPFSSDPFHLIA